MTGVNPSPLTVQLMGSHRGSTAVQAAALSAAFLAPGQRTTRILKSVRPGAALLSPHTQR